MVEAALVIAAILVVASFAEWMGDKLAPIFSSLGHFFISLYDNIYLVCAIITFLAAIYYLIFFKPHKAARYFKQYKEGKITRQKAIIKISNTMYNPMVEKIPRTLNSKIKEKRIKALRKRVRAEQQFVDDLIKYMRTKSNR